MPKDTLSVVDNRTGQSYEIPITDGTIRALDLRQIKTSPEDFGMMTYDPAFTNTASCHSSITYIDGDKGILRYRGYDIADLAENCNFLQVAYLIVHGELPTPAEEKQWLYEINRRMFVFENIKKFMDGFRYDAHPMGILISTIAALSTFYPSSKNVRDPEEQLQNIYRLIGKVPIIAAYAYRHRKGLPYISPDPDLSYPENFMNMLWRKSELKFLANPVLARALDVLWILHADHEQNCSANAMRSVGSSEADPFVATAAAAAALSGPLHGGANEEVLIMLDKIGSKDNIPEYIKGVKEGKYKLMGFGHRVYKNYDPRAKIIKRTADEVFKVTGRNPKIDIAIELEQIALNDEYFIKRKLYPNVDFYSGIIYQAMGFTPEMFTVMFAIPRTAGWLAQWRELANDPEQKIARPRQIYTGHELRRIDKPMLTRAVHAD
ncbi:MAG TPA: citrate synthase [Terriglobales bacterium]|nr:citrate synthase [Terriglobales bacterium]